MVDPIFNFSEGTDALGQAVVRIAELWNLSNSQLGTILGLPSAGVVQLRCGEVRLDPRWPSFERAQGLLQLFGSLDAMVAGDDDAARRWLESDNHDLGGPPLARLATLHGLRAVCEYIDIHRQPC